jgi:HK97 family phage major capsid protein
MFSPAVERYLKGLVSSGYPTFPEMRTGKILCGFPYTLNVAMPTSITTGLKRTMLFGNFAHGITVREVTPQLLVSRERFAEQNMLYSSLRADADCLVTDVYAINVLQQA